MRILGIDTATKFLCLGIYDRGRIYEYNLEVGPRLSTLLVVTIKRVLDALHWRIGDIGYFACGLGPGSFTGVRVGLAAIKGFAFALNKPIIGVSTLDILAGNAKTTDGYIVPAIDAKRSLIYNSIYKTRNGRLKRIAPYRLSTIDEFLKNIGHNVTILGDAAGLYKEIILKSGKGVTILDKDNWCLKGHRIIELALERIKAGKFNSAPNLKPVYLYPKECQIKNGI